MYQSHSQSQDGQSPALGFPIILTKGFAALTKFRYTLVRPLPFSLLSSCLNNQVQPMALPKHIL